MPDRKEPGSAWFTSAHIGVATAGVVGIVIDASPAAVSVLGGIGTWGVVGWSLLFTVSGVLGVLARARGWYWAETTAVDMTTAGLWLWGAMVLAAGHPAATQAGIMFLSAGLLLNGWSLYRKHRLRIRRTLIIEGAVREGLRT